MRHGECAQLYGTMRLITYPSNPSLTQRATITGLKLPRTIHESPPQSFETKVGSR